MIRNELSHNATLATQIVRKSYVNSILADPNDFLHNDRKIFWEKLYLNIAEQNQKLMQSQTALTNHNISLPQPSLASPQISFDRTDEIVESFFQIPVNDDLSNANLPTPNQDNFEQEIYRILNNESPPNQTTKPNNLYRELIDTNPSPLKKSRTYI